MSMGNHDVCCLEYYLTIIHVNSFINNITFAKTIVTKKREPTTDTGGPRLEQQL